MIVTEFTSCASRAEFILEWHRLTGYYPGIQPQAG